jgi:hypothetical protein
MVIASLIMDRFDFADWERLFQEFLVMSLDPDLSWISQPTFDLDKEVFNMGDPFTALRFFKGEIQVRSRSRIEPLPPFDAD